MSRKYRTHIRSHAYEERVACLDVVSTGRDRGVIQQQLCIVIESLVKDVAFLTEGLKNADEIYQTKFNSP